MLLPEVRVNVLPDGSEWKAAGQLVLTGSANSNLTNVI
jgi:hypothetical protein